MFRNLFAVFATLTLGAGAAAASTPTTDTTGLTLEQRVQAAQKTIGSLTGVSDERPSQAGSRLVQYWNNYYRPWHNWNNWHNYYNPGY